MLEAESLGPLVNLKPRQSAEHIEDWSLFRNVPPLHDDEDVVQYVSSKVRLFLSF